MDILGTFTPNRLFSAKVPATCTPGHHPSQFLCVSDSSILCSTAPAQVTAAHDFCHHLTLITAACRPCRDPLGISSTPVATGWPKWQAQGSQSTSLVTARSPFRDFSRSPSPPIALQHLPLYFLTQSKTRQIEGGKKKFTPPGPC